MRTYKTLLITLSLLFSGWAFAGVPTNAGDTCPIKVGEKIPALVLEDVDGKAFDMNAQFSKKPTVLIFYRGSWCPYCNTHLGEMQTIEAKLQALGYQVIALSPDLPENLKTSVEKNKLTYTLVSDNRAEAAKSLGLAFKVDPKTYEKYIGWGIDLEKSSGQKHHLLPIPAAIVVDKEGVAKFVHASPDYKARINPRLLLVAAEEALK